MAAKQVVPFVIRSLGKAACRRQDFINEIPKKTLLAITKDKQL